MSCLIAAVLASGAYISQASARQVPFSDPPTISDNTGFATSIHAADIDGDGILDALSASRTDDKIAWHQNTAGDASSWTLRTISTAILDAAAVFPADVDGDGDLDAVSGSIYDGQVSWHENTAGDGSNWTLHTISTSISKVRSTIAADIDRDGDLDVVTQSSNINSIHWHENQDGVGTTWTTHQITNSAGYAYEVFTSDVDGDGDLDVLVAARDTDEVLWFENDGSGGTWNNHTITTTAQSAISVSAADLDGDGDIDALSASYIDDKLAWYENTAGDGSAWSIHTIVSGGNDLGNVSVVDVDHDGDIDVISDRNGLEWFENDGSGSSWTSHTIGNASPRFINSADLDSDGDSDFLVAAGNSMDWFRNDTIHRSAALSAERIIYDQGNSASFVGSADLDGDGDQDAISTAFLSDTLYWHENDGSAGNWSPHTIAIMTDAYSAVATDLDGDGDIDIVTPSSSDGKVNWFENDGSGSSWITHTISTSTDGARELAFTDVDKDGDTDIVSVSRDIDTVAWHEGDGTGTSWTTHVVSSSLDGGFSVFAGDIDTDGDADIVAGALFDDKVVWYENDGAGGSWSIHTVSLTTDGLRSVSGGDMDRDGDLDIATTSSADNQIEWYENDGQGVTWTRHLVFAGADTPDRGLPFDLDHDGDLDLLAASNGDNTIAWHENTGAGLNWVVHTITTTADFAEWASASDLDGDGDLDALSASTTDDTIAWYENRGGQFALPTLTTAQKIVNNSETHDLLDIEAVHLGRTGDSDAELATIELNFTDDGGVDLTSAEAEALIENIHIYLDTGSGKFEEGSDQLLETISNLTLSSGVLTINIPDGFDPDFDTEPEFQFGVGEPFVYFIVAQMTSNADGQTPSAFQVGHVTDGSSTGEDAAADIPLTLEFWPNTGTGVVDTALDSTSCEAPFDLELSDRTVTTTVACQAGTFIRAGTSFTVGSGGDLSLAAGETVRFTSGFHVDTGTLTVTIDPTL